MMSMGWKVYGSMRVAQSRGRRCYGVVGYGHGSMKWGRAMRYQCTIVHVDKETLVHRRLLDTDCSFDSEECMKKWVDHWNRLGRDHYYAVKPGSGRLDDRYGTNYHPGEP